jgi:hypothetical protein
MNTEAKKNKMTLNGFLKKATAAKSASGFLAQYREYMVTGELAEVLSPIVAKVDEGALLPTPAVLEISNAVMTHIIVLATLKTEMAIENGQSTGTKKNYLGTVLDDKGNVCTRIKDNGEEEDLIKGFDLPQDCLRWLDRRLFDGASTWHGKMEHAHSSFVEVVGRDESIARILKQPKGPAIHKKGVSTKSLGFGVRAKESRSSFSRG